MNQIKPPMLYKVQVIKNDYPKSRFDFDLMVQVNFSDGKVLQSTLSENLRQWVGHTEMIDMISASMSCKLLEGLQKNLQAQISEMIWEMIKEEK
jgi:hypothetical protein